jgi:methionine-gamma-lyase
MSLKKLDDSTYSIPTRLIYGPSVSTEWDYSHHVVPPLTTSSSFRLDSASRGAKGFSEIGQRMSGDEGNPIYVYDRMGEPNVDLLQQSLAIAEQGEIAVTFSTGMAAVAAASMFALYPNAHVISHKTVYGCTYSLFKNWFPKFGYEVTFEDLTNPESFLEHVKPNTRVLYLESPVNPTLGFLDIQKIALLVKDINKNRPKEKQIITVIDNTFATPYCQRPITYGIDVVLHSLTKGISGFGVDMGGAVITRKEYWEQLIMYRKDFGGTLSPQSAWHILVFGLSTLPLRIPKQQENALKIAKFLEEHPLVEKVSYPGLESFPQYETAKRHMIDYNGNFAPGIVLYFTLKGTPEQSKARGEAMMDFIASNAYSVTLAVSLGQVRTLIEHPGSMTHAAYPAEEQVKFGIDPGGIRLALGIENHIDIQKDLERALETVKSI